MTDLAVSRRAVTRAIVTLPALAAAPALAASPIYADTALKTEWDRLMREYLAGKHISDEYERLHFNPLCEAQKAKFGTSRVLADDARIDEYKAWRRLHNADEIEDRFEAHVEAQSNAEVALLEAPAPDLAALGWKLCRTINQSGITPWCKDIADVIHDDIVRLMPSG